MRKSMKWVVASGSVLGAAAMMSAGAGAVSGHAPEASISLVASNTDGGVVGADQAAVIYVDTNYPGSGVANVLSTKADTEDGVAVYDVSIVAPDGFTYTVSVQQSTDVVVSANLADNQVTALPTTPSPVITPPTNGPTVITPSGGVETESGDSTEAMGTQDASTSAEDAQIGTSVSDSIDTQNGSLGLGASVDASTGGSASSGGSGDNQGAGSNSVSVPSDASASTSTSSDG